MKQGFQVPLVGASGYLNRVTREIEMARILGFALKQGLNMPAVSGPFPVARCVGSFISLNGTLVNS